MRYSVANHHVKCGLSVVSHAFLLVHCGADWTHECRPVHWQLDRIVLRRNFGGRSILFFAQRNKGSYEPVTRL
jgi:hypothetical protein